MSIEKLKEKARRHEQKEEWQKALNEYTKAIAQLSEDDQPDPGLHNRVGDLFVRVGNLDQSVKHYEQAVDLYVEAYLPNNAIAVCKKVIRNVPDRHVTYLKMGQIRAEQGFMPDARTNFLTYAERVAKAGDMDESLRALKEFAEVAPGDAQVRLFLAEQLASHDREREGLTYLIEAYHVLDEQGESQEAAGVRARILEMDPDADLSARPAPEPDEGAFASFGEISLGDGPPAEAVEEAKEEAVSADSGAPDEADGGEDDGVEMEDFAITSAEDQAGAGAPEDGAPDDLPMMEVDFDDEEEEESDVEAESEAESEADELPMMAVDFDDEDEADELPMMAVDFDDDDEDEGFADLDSVDQMAEAVEAAQEESVSSRGSVAEEAEELTAAAVRARLSESPDDVALHQRMIELAYSSGQVEELVDAYAGLAGALERTGEDARARAAWQQVLDVDPTHEEAQAGVASDDGPPTKPVKEVAANDDYVDLGSMIFGDEEEKTTRFTVAYEEPSGDEEADFAKMLSQFKNKVSENLEANDVGAHHDLGTAYKEMGLLDEAISEFQAALRADSAHLPTYELMGQTFLEMGNPDQAVRSLERALRSDYKVEDELLGIYYYLARAHEQKGNTEAALEFYDRVFSLDINFADVTERLRSLRPA